MSRSRWKIICLTEEISPNLGVRALVGEKQIAIFRVQNQLYAIAAIDPFTKAAVLSRGIVGDIKGQVVVASPIYKQHFSLQTGACLEDETVFVETFPIRETNGSIEIEIAS